MLGSFRMEVVPLWAIYLWGWGKKEKKCSSLHRHPIVKPLWSWALSWSLGENGSGPKLLKVDVLLPFVMGIWNDSRILGLPGERKSHPDTRKDNSDVQKENRSGMHKECACTGENTGVTLGGAQRSLLTDLRLFGSNWGMRCILTCTLYNLM